MKLRLDNKWFNPLYFHLRHYVNDPNIRKVMVYGGKAGAKTFSLSQLFLILGISQQASSLIYRKEQTSVKNTVKESLEKAIRSLHFDRTYNVLDFRINGMGSTKIVLKGLDNEGKIKGIEGFKYLLFDELDHFTKEDWMQANLSLRGLPNQKLFATWNPISEHLWIKKELDEIEWVDMPLMLPGNPMSQLHENSFIRLSKDGKTLLIKTTYFDNKWVVGANGYGHRDENLIYEYEKLKTKDDNWYRVNVLGEWGRIMNGAEFYPQFKKGVHVKPCEYLPDLPVHLSFDFNVVPYMTMICAQVVSKENKMQIRFFREYCKATPDNSSRAVCRYFVRDFGSFKPVVFYYGDASGKNRIEGQGNKRNFDDIEAELVQYCHSHSDRVNSRNPNVFKRRDFENLIFAGYFDDIEIVIDPSCTELIKDLEMVKTSIDGKFKERFNDKVMGVSYEKYGHTSDAMDYFLVALLWELYNATSGR